MPPPYASILMRVNQRPDGKSVGPMTEWPSLLFHQYRGYRAACRMDGGELGVDDYQHHHDYHYQDHQQHRSSSARGARQPLSMTTRTSTTLTRTTPITTPITLYHPLLSPIPDCQCRVLSQMLRPWVAPPRPHPAPAACVRRGRATNQLHIDHTPGR
jgi:hypothetical protein